MELTSTELESIRLKAIGRMQKRLEALRPDPEQYKSVENRAVQMISDTLIWSKAFVPVIALLAALASAVRTVQTAAEIYSAAGSNPIGVGIAAIAFTLASEGALFTLALAQEGQRMKWRQEAKPRRVASLLNLWNGFLVRLGFREPLRYDQLPESDGIGTVIAIAFMFTVASNAYLGLRPLLSQIGNSSSLQTFISSILTADAKLQMSFVVDMAAVLFPPFMALQAGHLTARFAAEVADGSTAGERKYQRALDEWNEAYNAPLDTESGKQLLNDMIDEKIKAKVSRVKEKALPENEVQEDFLAMAAGRERGDSV